MNPRFFSLAAAANILHDFSPVVLMAGWSNLCHRLRRIDLSVGSVLGLAGVAMALVISTLNDSGFNPAVTIALGLGAAMCVGAFIGLLNGLLIAYARIVPFIATLAMMGAAAGLTIVITGGVEVAGGPREVILLGSSRFLGVFTTPVVVAFLILVIAWASLSRTRFGRWTYAVGSNFFAARAAGIDLNAHIIRSICFPAFFRLLP